MTGILRKLRKCYSALLLSGELERRAWCEIAGRAEDGDSDQIKIHKEHPLPLPIADIRACRKLRLLLGFRRLHRNDREWGALQSFYDGLSSCS